MLRGGDGVLATGGVGVGGHHRQGRGRMHPGGVHENMRLGDGDTATVVVIVDNLFGDALPAPFAVPTARPTHTC